MLENDKILIECRETLEKGGAVATSIGVFALVVNREGSPLLRKRSEKDSLYQEDLSGKWEMTGGGLEISHFTAETGPDDSSYQQAIFACLKQELLEEAGLNLISLPRRPFMFVLPAWRKRSYKDRKVINEERTSIDLAFATPVPFQDKYVEKTEEFENKIERGELMFVPRQELSNTDIVSLKMRFLIEETLEMFYLIRGLLEIH